jgi:hypothetical protein
MDDKLKCETLSEIKAFLTYINTNNFDRYFSEVLPRSGINYTYVSKNSLFNPTKQQVERQRKQHCRKNMNPKRIQWVDGHVTEILMYDPLTSSEEELNDEHSDKAVRLVARKTTDNRDVADQNQSINNNQIKTTDYKYVANENQSIKNNIIKSKSSKVDLTPTLNNQYIPLSFDLPLREDEDTTTGCLFCSWEYPTVISNEEKNAHLNYCLEGRGEEHRTNYMASLKIVNLTAKKEDKIKSINDVFTSCPNCGKRFKCLNSKIVDSHIIDCLKESEDLQIYSKTKKRKTKTLNN